MRATRGTAAPPGAGDGRPPLALRRAETARLCRGCTLCCTYVTVEIDSPRAAWEYDQWLWALHHRGVELYVDRPERWSLHFATRCAELGRDGRCRVHGRHPVMCREHDPRTCERWLPLGDVRAWFRAPGELEAWMRTERPAHWRRLVAWRRARALGRPARTARRTAVIRARAPASSRRSG